MNKVLILAVALGGFLVLFAVGRAWKLKPETPANHMLHKGEQAMVANTAGKAVWLATSKQDTYTLQQAMGRQDQAALEQAAAQGAAFPVQVGTRVRVRSEAISRLEVEVLDGPDAGRTGWAEFEYLRPLLPSESQ